MHIFTGLYKGRILQSPKGLKTRPTSGRLRECLFNICQYQVEDSAFLDLFAGSGAMGIEALSREAKSATFIDNSKESVRCIQTNLQALNITKQAEVMYGNVFDLIDKLILRKRAYAIIYADPPYEQTIEETGESFSEKILKLIDESITNATPLLSKGGSLFLEDAANALPQSIELKHLKLKSSRQLGRSALQHYLYE